MNNEKWEKEFDEKFPEFRGIGAVFPIFDENPNREHIKSFIKATREEAIKETLLKLLEEMPKENEERREILKVIQILNNPIFFVKDLEAH